MGSSLSLEERTVIEEYGVKSFSYFSPTAMQGTEEVHESSGELSVSFEYLCSNNQIDPPTIPCKSVIVTGDQIQNPNIKIRSSSFSCLSGAALSANATLANTNICNGLLGEEILPGLDSPKSFRRLPSSPSLSRLDLLSPSSQSSTSTMAGSVTTENEMLDSGRILLKTMSSPTGIESSSFLNAVDVQMAGGAAGEDRVQAVCSEENGWLFCGVYDGFNGRDAADFLAGTLYENIGYYIHWLEMRTKQPKSLTNGGSSLTKLLEGSPNGGCSLANGSGTTDCQKKPNMLPDSQDIEFQSKTFRHGVMDCLCDALAQAEHDYMFMVEREMDDRPDLVSVGSCVLAVLLHGNVLYVLNLGDSRAVLATTDECQNGLLRAIQLTEIHSVDNKVELGKVVAEHPDDPSPIIRGRVKGKLKLTRAFGVGYLKKKKLNDALMGILQVSNLISPPYVSANPFVMNHTVSENDLFVVLGSDGLFDFFSNNEVVQLVHQFIQGNPFADPAKHLVEHLVRRAAEKAGFTTEELMSIPVGRRRKYHDDVTIIVIILGNKQRMSTASTSL
ncbi:putative protein phosphatase 2C 39 [Acorus calamus]|uniref:protein-serine/threonine phosphatase n=1 Tax=Acorus calamus TaxID=4465 RepID=A0AAV9D2S6_ACOCL|nr:putative protein phosphatase 2C 39 [Acorus calamus]